MEEKELLREQVAEKDTWKLEDIYATEAEWEQEYDDLTRIIPQLEQRKETILQDAKSLALGLKEIDKAAHMAERLYVYAKMKKDVNNLDEAAQARADRSLLINVRLSSAVSYINPLLLSVDSKVLLQYLSDCPDLSDYRFMIHDLLRMKNHVLSEKEERLLSMSGDFAGGAREIFTMLNNADLTFGTVKNEQGDTVQLTHGRYINLMHSHDRQVRENTYHTYYASFRQMLNTIAATYATSVKKDVFYAQSRGYQSALEKALYADNVPVSLYDRLIEIIHKNLPTMYRYIDIRKKVLGIDDFKMYDIYAPLVKDIKNNYSYAQAVEINIKGLRALGEEYMQTFERAFSERWVDVYETKAKTSGAYCFGTYGVHPYVLLNHRGDLDSVFTIAHEMGHAMHSYYSDKNQPYPLAGYTIFVAEVASTVNEILLTKYLLAHTEDERVRLYILNNYIDQFRTTVFRQTMFAEFEKIVHQMAEEGRALTAKEFSKVYGDLNRLYYGPQVDTDEDISLEWARIPHFYNAFYVYKYATGFSCAVQIANHIHTTGDTKGYMEFLKSGGSDYPLEILKKADVDLLSGEPIESCMAAFADAVDAFEKAVL